MAQKLEIYECMVCGNVVEVIRDGAGEPMKNLVAKTSDAGKEKHTPVIEKVNGSFKVKIGSIPRPMEEKHYIEWIELLADSKTHRQFLNPGDRPEVIFNIEADTVHARDYCNMHGLWEK